MNNTTAYRKEFGNEVSRGTDFKVLRDKQLSKLAIAQVLKPAIREMLTRWLKMNDQDKFTIRIFTTVREMYTVVKNQLADVSTSHEFHASHQSLNTSVPRFDRFKN